MERIKPRALSKGHTIGLIAPSSKLPEPERLPVAIRRLETMGYRVKLAESCTASYGYLAGDDALRAEAVNGMFRDDTVDAILCVRGGYGATRILPLLDYDVIRANPKVFSGYSDITALHSALMARTGLITFHGLMAVPDFGGDGVDAFSLDGFFRAVTSAALLGPIENPPDCARETLVPGQAEGPLIGGNLTLVASCLGTPYAYPFDGAILFLEEVSERSYAVDRLFAQIRNAGALERCAGVILGTFKDCEPKPESGDLRLSQIFADMLGGLQKPVLAGVQFGHETRKVTLPIGVRCRLDATAQTVQVLEGAVYKDDHDDDNNGRREKL